MKIKLLLIVFTVITMLGCNKSDESKKTGDPAEDLAWLKKIKDEKSANCTCVPSIWQATYEGTTIYETGCAGPACQCVHLFYTEKGEAVPGSEENNRVAFLSKIKDRKEVWSCGK